MTVTGDSGGYAEYRNNTRSLVMTRIGGQEYALRSHPRCGTCTSPYRAEIEAELVRGQASLTAIVREFADRPPPEGRRPGVSRLTVNSISLHIKNDHLPLGAAVRRRMVERRALETGKSIENSEEPLADYLTLNQMIVQQGLEQIADGKMDLSATDVIAASKFLRQVEQETGDTVDAQVWTEALMTYMEIAQKFIPADQWNSYGAALHGSPVLRALAAKQAAGPSDGEADEVVAEVVEDDDTGFADDSAGD